MAGIIEIFIRNHRADVLRKLEYRKTAADCINTWRISYAIVAVLIASLTVVIIYFLATFSIYNSMIVGFLSPVYIALSVSSIHFLRHAKKVLKAYKFQHHEELSKFIKLRSLFKIAAQEKFRI